MSIKNDEFLNLFDKTGKKIKTGELGNDTIEIDGLSKGDKVSQGDYTVGIQNEHEDKSHAVFGVPGFSAVAPTTTSTTTTTEAPKTTSTTTTTVAPKTTSTTTTTVAPAK